MGPSPNCLIEDLNALGDSDLASLLLDAGEHGLHCRCYNDLESERYIHRSAVFAGGILMNNLCPGSKKLINRIRFLQSK